MKQMQGMYLLMSKNLPLIMVFRRKFLYGARQKKYFHAGIFSAILGRGPRAFLIGKISDIHPEFGKFSKHSKLMIFSNLT